MGEARRRFTCDEIREFARIGTTHMDALEFEVFEARAQHALCEYVTALGRFSIGRDRAEMKVKTDAGFQRLVAMLSDPAQCAAQRDACYGSGAPRWGCDAQYTCCMNGC
jgi:hypothetical protein